MQKYNNNVLIELYKSLYNVQNISSNTEIILNNLELIRNNHVDCVLFYNNENFEKTNAINEFFPLIYAGENKDKYIFYINNTMQKVIDIKQNIIRTLRTLEFDKLYPMCNFNDQFTYDTVFKTTNNNTFKFCSIGSAVAGYGCDLMIFDELINTYNEINIQRYYDELLHKLCRLHPKGKVITSIYCDKTANTSEYISRFMHDNKMKVKHVFLETSI